MRLNIFVLFILDFLVFVSCNSEDPNPINSSTPQNNGSGNIDTLANTESPPSFLEFDLNQASLNALIASDTNIIEVDVTKVNHDTDISRVTPSFRLPDGYNAFVNDEIQISNTSVIDLSKPIEYIIRDTEDNEYIWSVEFTPFPCKVLIDASHGGGVWWFPQYGEYDPDQWHQGTPIVTELKKVGLEIVELGRNETLTEDTFLDYKIIIRTSGFRTYSISEVDEYAKILENGINLALFTDHKTNDKEDEIAEYLELYFEGTIDGTVGDFVTHALTQDMKPFQYGVGSYLSNAEENDNVVAIAKMIDGDFKGEVVMGVLNHPKSKITFFGDMNSFQFQAQPYFNNLINWIGECTAE